MTDRKLLEQALDALIENARLLGITQAKQGYGFYSQQDAIVERALHECIAKHSAALLERLAQPEQEPVAYVIRTLSGKSISDEIAPTQWATFESKIEKLRADPWVQNGIAEIIPLYTVAPTKRQPLTDEEISAIDKSIPDHIVLEEAKFRFARLIEQAHGIEVKND